MKCAWKELLGILPLWMRKEVDRFRSNQLLEIRLRLNSCPELRMKEKSSWLERKISREDIQYTINLACRYSPWSVGSVAQGYITVMGGHRIGICGETVFRQGAVSGYREYSSVCIRIARDHTGIADGLERIQGSVLIIGPPGWGKTTLLRDLIRKISLRENVCVVDERGELFPFGFEKGEKTDVLSGCSKQNGISMLIRTMGPSYIAVDEITAPEDADAIVHAAYCGVKFLATAHGENVSEFYNRSTYRRLLENRIFDTVVILNRDWSYTVERMNKWVSDGLARC